MASVPPLFSKSGRLVSMLPDGGNEARLRDGEARAEHRDDDARKDERVGASYERRALYAAANGKRSDRGIIREAHGEL